MITVSYLALMRSHEADGIVNSPNIQWHEVRALPELYLDHSEIIKIANQRLVSKLGYSTIAFQLAPELFTLSELQRIYEIILDEALDKRNFRKRIQALEHVEKTDLFRRNRAHRPARFYRYAGPNELHYIK